MQLTQFKHWLHSPEGALPKCVVVSHAGSADYLMEVEFKHQLVPLKDDEDQMLKFKNMEQVAELLKPLGITSVILRMIDPYDEFSPDNQISSCREEMVITL
ncbi:hypothetical protein A3K86_11250 [Photobacterium jeanii]|uniref:Uncharacterized protein n=1 Tax=Photobacterium jeanii TaxID=858640 RepID=A0A178KB10_9GAMM|nr:DUF6482 family protein [Photobacterium jeanii]OAN14155.1 hypothetical protein A3K86_11250 [Photobacterium jeanii]PST89674.1 hypothetical protein C9I91_11860 [Photobacterium jeanii]